MIQAWIDELPPVPPGGGRVLSGRERELVLIEHALWLESGDRYEADFSQAPIASLKLTRSRRSGTLAGKMPPSPAPYSERYAHG